MEELPVIDQNQFSRIQRLVEHRRFSALARVQVGFSTLDIVPSDRVNTDKIGAILVYAFRREP
jgi:hypothetical protein